MTPHPADQAKPSAEIISQILRLTQAALDELDTPGIPLSRTIRKAIRVARLRRDYVNLYWLEAEVRTRGDEAARRQIIAEVSPHFTREQGRELHKRTIEAFLNRRTLEHLQSKDDPDNSPAVLALSVPEIEGKIEHLRQMVADLTTPKHIHSFDYMALEERNAGIRRQAMAGIADSEAVLRRIATAVHEYLSRTEQELVYGQQHADIFEQNRRYVHERLAVLAPGVNEQLRAASTRVREGGSEAFSHALTSCRRTLKSVADCVYPARAEPVLGSDGKARDLSDDKYIARLWQFVSEAVSGSTTRKMVLSSVEEIGKKIDRLYDVSSKGVHADVTSPEVHQCVMQTYILVGDILRLHDGQSGADSDWPPEGEGSDAS